VADAWQQSFDQLSQYVRAHGDARVGSSYVSTDGYRLGGWVTTQRFQRSKGTLSTSRQQQLEELAGWTWDPSADKWEQGLSRLKDYIQRHGNAQVAKSYRAGDGYRLGAWVPGWRCSVPCTEAAASPPSASDVSRNCRDGNGRCTAPVSRSHVGGGLGLCAVMWVARWDAHSALRTRRSRRT
jgi:Helicase associated domain